MKHEDIVKFAENNNPNVDLICIKSGGDYLGTYKLFLTAFIKQLPGIIGQIDGWSEEDIFKEMTDTYKSVVDHYREKYKIFMPDNLIYTVRYVDDAEWRGVKEDDEA